MGIFNHRQEPEDDFPRKRLPREIKDLKPENKKRRKEPVKPWGRAERLIVLATLIFTVGTSGVLALSARDWKLPGLPRLKIDLPSWSWNSKPIVIEADKSAEKLLEERTIADFKDATRNLSGVYGLYVLRLSDGSSYGYLETEVFQAASMIKLPVMLYAQGKVDDTKIEAMGKRSDNAVFIELVAKFGREKLQRYIDELGMPNTSLAENETTPKEMGDLFAKIYKDNNQQMMDVLTDTNFEAWLTAGVPENVRVAHKYGREIHVVNDGGIVFTGQPFVVVIMSKGVVEREADEIFPKLAQIIYQAQAK